MDRGLQVFTDYPRIWFALFRSSAVRGCYIQCPLDNRTAIHTFSQLRLVAIASGQARQKNQRQDPCAASGFYSFTGSAHRYHPSLRGNIHAPIHPEIDREQRLSASKKGKARLLTQITSTTRIHAIFACTKAKARSVNLNRIFRYQGAFCSCLSWQPHDLPSRTIQLPFQERISR
jgi:hypothetical protein